jgi:xylan 1,4-beta-xylosidase
VGVLATRAQNGRVDILLWHYQDDDVPGPPADVHLLLAGLPPGLEHQARVWRVDRDSGDAFSAWKAMGSPVTPTRDQVDRLTSASRMSARPLRIGHRAHNGSVSLERSLPLQSVELIELGP